MTGRIKRAPKYLSRIAFAKVVGAGQRTRNWFLVWRGYAWCWTKILWGSLIHGVTGQTPKYAHLALVTLFTYHGGREHDFLAKVIGIFHPPYRLRETSGVLGRLTPEELAAVLEKLECDGYHVFENCLSPEFCDAIVRRSVHAECHVTGDELVGQAQVRRYERSKPTAAMYTLTRDDTTDIPEIQQLLSDPSIIAVAQNYLKSKPIISAVSMSWSAAVKSIPDKEAAQEFHWDMERIKWLRFFIYLTDVTPDSGPHCFIAGTHRARTIPHELLRLGYARHSDDAILNVYGQDAYREFVGPRGTIIAEDSRGFHKGLMPRKGDRLLLAFEVSNTTFGVNKRHLIRHVHVPRFGEYARLYPRVYMNFDFAPGARISS
jgi:hypothetical protein